MKNYLFIGALFVVQFGFSQTNAELQKEIAEIKTSIANLHKEIQSVKSENIYLKTVLDINKPILEKKDDNTLFKITKVTGHKKDKTISITFLVESKDVNKKMGQRLSPPSIIDLEGNEFKVDYDKSNNIYPDLSKDIPIKVIYTFKDVSGEPKIIKLFRCGVEFTEKDSYKNTRADLEFKDLNVTWE